MTSDPVVVSRSGLRAARAGWIVVLAMAIGGLGVQAYVDLRSESTHSTVEKIIHDEASCPAKNSDPHRCRALLNRLLHDATTTQLRRLDHLAHAHASATHTAVGSTSTPRTTSTKTSTKAPSSPGAPNRSSGPTGSSKPRPTTTIHHPAPTPTHPTTTVAATPAPPVAATPATEPPASAPASPSAAVTVTPPPAVTTTAAPAISATVPPVAGLTVPSVCTALLAINC